MDSRDHADLELPTSLLAVGALSLTLAISRANSSRPPLLFPSTTTPKTIVLARRDLGVAVDIPIDGATV